MNITSLFFVLKSSTIEIPFKEEYRKFKNGDYVVIKTDEFSEEIAKVQRISFIVKHSDKIDLSGEILRKAMDLDLQQQENNKKKEALVADLFKTKTLEMELDMHLVAARYSLDGSLIYITFLADSRVDFRELVKQLAQSFQKKIHLQQIGPRDKSALYGGYGLCGQEFCCTKFMGSIPSVTMDAVRAQNLAYKGTEKLSGQCGKLMCCLNYEKSQYKKMIAKFPKYGNDVKVKGEIGTVIGLDILNDKVKVKFDNFKIETVLLSEIEKDFKTKK